MIERKRQDVQIPYPVSRRVPAGDGIARSFGDAEMWFLPRISVLVVVKRVRRTSWSLILRVKLG